MKAIATMLMICGALMLAGLSPAEALTSTGECDGMTQTNFLMSDATDTTQVSAGQMLTDGQVTFTMGAPGCAVVTFSAPAMVSNEANPAVYPGLHVIFLVDGSRCQPNVNFPDYLVQAPNGNLPVGTSMARICDGLSAGAHTLQVWYSIDVPSHGTFHLVGTIYGHTITVAHP